MSHILKDCPECGRPRTKKWLKEKKDLRILRLKSALKSAKDAGYHIGRPRKRNDKLILELRKLGFSMRQIANKCGLSATTVHAALKGD